MLSNFPNGVMSFGNAVFGNLGIGNVYNVCQTTNTVVYADLVLRYGGQTYENDGSVLLHSTIESALAATVECRNDYVVVWPQDSDYDITAALALNKKAVHLICPAGMGYDIGCNNAVRIDQTTAGIAVMAISDAAIEVAGFYLKPYIGREHFTLAAASYAVNIHHNYLPLKWTSTNYAAIAGTGDAGAWGKIERNCFVSQAGDDKTCAAIVDIQSSATATEVSHNQFTIGDGNTATLCISNAAVKGNTNFNVFSTSGGTGVADGGIITNAIYIHASGCAIGNRGAVGSGELLSGGTAAHSFCDNLDGRSTAGTDIWNLET